jgi:ABC-2 type transport system ATP-binding protein
MHALQISDLHKTYRNGTIALKGVNLTVEKGDFFALLGSNGAGKSTTIGIISGLVNKSAGKIKVFGHDFDTELSQAKSCIGLVPQEFNFNQFEPVIEILVNQGGYYGLPRAVAYERAEIYLKQLELWDKRDVMARELSGGMKRRLMIARALIHQPKLLILDEPTAGVDIEIRRTMWEFLAKINQQGTTIILTTHYLEEAESLCKNIAIIDHGLTIEHTSMKDLLSQLTTETFIFYLQSPLKNSDVLKQDEFAHFNIQLIDESTIEISLDKQSHINTLINQLTEHDINILSMRNKTNRLEQLFVCLVNKNRNNPELVETLQQTAQESPQTDALS